jgi:hypothetical protein
MRMRASHAGACLWFHRRGRMSVEMKCRRELLHLHLHRIEHEQPRLVQPEAHASMHRWLDLDLLLLRPFNPHEGRLLWHALTRWAEVCHAYGSFGTFNPDHDGGARWARQCRAWVRQCCRAELGALRGTAPLGACVTDADAPTVWHRKRADDCGNQVAD